jgi:hypothetical protein
MSSPIRAGLGGAADAFGARPDGEVGEAVVVEVPDAKGAAEAIQAGVLQSTDRSAARGFATMPDEEPRYVSALPPCRILAPPWRGPRGARGW